MALKTYNVEYSYHVPKTDTVKRKVYANSQEDALEIGRLLFKELQTEVCVLDEVKAEEVK